MTKIIFLASFAHDHVNILLGFLPEPWEGWCKWMTMRNLKCHSKSSSANCSRNCLSGKFHFGLNSLSKGVYVFQKRVLAYLGFFSLREFWLWQVVVHNKDLLTFSLVRLLWLDLISLIITLIRNCFYLVICPSCVWGFIGYKLYSLIPQVHEQRFMTWPLWRSS